VVRGQAAVLTTLLLTAAALAISLALWSYFVSVASVQREQALIASTITRESTRIVLTRISTVSVTVGSERYYRFVYQVSTLDSQPALIYLLILSSFTTTPTPIDFNMYLIRDPYSNITNTSTLTPISDVEFRDSRYVFIRPINVNEHVELSLYWKGTVGLHKFYMEGPPTAIVVEVRASDLSDAWLVTLIKISNRYYQIGMNPIP